MVKRNCRIVNESSESNFRNPYGANGVEVHRELSEARNSKGSLCFPALPNGGFLHSRECRIVTESGRLCPSTRLLLHRRTAEQLIEAPNQARRSRSTRAKCF